MNIKERLIMAFSCIGLAIFIRIVYPQLNDDWLTYLITIVLWGIGGYNMGALVKLNKDKIKKIFGNKK